MKSAVSVLSKRGGGAVEMFHVTMVAMVALRKIVRRLLLTQRICSHCSHNAPPGLPSLEKLIFFVSRVHQEADGWTGNHQVRIGVLYVEVGCAIIHGRLDNPASTVEIPSHPFSPSTVRPCKVRACSDV